MNKRKIVGIISLLLCVSFCFGCGKKSKVEKKEQGFIDLSGSQMVDQMAPGWNLGNQLEVMENDRPIKEELIKAVKAAGFRSIRIPISYMRYIGEKPNYIIDENWIKHTQEVIDLCISNGLYVIINIDGDAKASIKNSWILCNEKDQTGLKDKFKAVWKQIAEQYKEYDEHLIFESMNQEAGHYFNRPDASCYKNFNEYNQIFVDTVRNSGGKNDHRWLIIPGWNSKIEYTDAASGFKIPTEGKLSNRIPSGEKRIMLSVHYNTTSCDLNHLYEDFISQGYPCVISEYGRENGRVSAQLCKKVCQESKKMNCIPMYWDDGNNGELGSGIFNRNTYEIVRPQILSSIMKEYSRKDKKEKTKIDLNYASVKLQTGKRKLGMIKLTASFDSEEERQEIFWSSEDDSIASVNEEGKVTAHKSGKTIIYARTSSGAMASCRVEVEDKNCINVRLYAIDTTQWITLASEEVAEISEDGGTYTLNLLGDEQTMKNLSVLYIKDQEVQKLSSPNSMFKEANIRIESVAFNGVDCEVTQKEKTKAIDDWHVFNCTILNRWNVGREKIRQIKQVPEGGPYMFTCGTYKEENNKVTVKFHVSDIKLE